MSQATLFASERKPWAIFSPCELYRYVLAWPTGLDDDSYALFVLANPLTATAEQTDPTVARCIAYSKRWGYGWCRVVNVRAWRETNPKLVPADPEAIGPENDDWILTQAQYAHLIVAGWGKLGGTRGRVVHEMLRQDQRLVRAFKLNKDGSPVHPLYQPNDAELVSMSGVA